MVLSHWRCLFAAKYKKYIKMQHVIKVEDVVIDCSLLPTIKYYSTNVTFLMKFFYSCLNAAGIEICFYKRKNEDFFGSH